MFLTNWQKQFKEYSDILENQLYFFTNSWMRYNTIHKIESLCKFILKLLWGFYLLQYTTFSNTEMDATNALPNKFTLAQGAAPIICLHVMASSWMYWTIGWVFQSFVSVDVSYISRWSSVFRLESLVFLQWQETKRTHTNIKCVNIIFAFPPFAKADFFCIQLKYTNRILDQ